MNHTVCEIVYSTRGQAKINVNGYIMVKNKNRNDLYYWSCEKHNTLYCKARATTVFMEGQHRLRQASNHNHGAEASRATVLRTVDSLKRRARETDKTPVQIIQTVVTNNPSESHPYLPSNEALRQTIKRIRRFNLPVEPTTLEDLTVPENLRVTINGSEFLVRDSTVGVDRLLLFTTIPNIRYLEQSIFWIMDGTFRTVPGLFSQLYTSWG